MICKPKANGGLGIINFVIKNEALLMKQLDKFYNKMDIPWVSLIWSTYYSQGVPHQQNILGSFWWRDIFKLEGKFREIAIISPGSGDTILFWKDRWNFMGSCLPLCQRFARLHSFALDDDLSVADVFAAQDLADLFYLPLSTQAFEEFGLLRDAIVSNPLLDQKDIWVYEWGDSFRSINYYNLRHAHMVVPSVYRWIWSSACIMKTKMFAWLLLSDRLNTRDMLKRRHWNVTEDTHCVLCAARAYEDRLHLFFGCNFSTRIWNYLQIDWSFHDDMHPASVKAKRNFGQPFFMEVS